MNIQNFRTDLRTYMEKNACSQVELAKLSGLTQANISKFLNGDRDILLSNALKLWGLVYGDLQRQADD